MTLMVAVSVGVTGGSPEVVNIVNDFGLLVAVNLGVPGGSPEAVGASDDGDSQHQ